MKGSSASSLLKGACVAGVATAIAVGVAGVGWLVCALMVSVIRRVSDTPVSDPSAWRFVVVSVVCGAVTGLAYGWLRSGGRRVIGIVAVVAAVSSVFIAPVAVAVNGHVNEQEFLGDLPDDMEGPVMLEAGHDACRWLAARPLARSVGRPPDDLQNWVFAYMRPKAGYDVFNSDSTTWLYIRYIQGLEAATPGPLTMDQWRHAAIAPLAWTQLCPFQFRIRGAVSDEDDGSD